MKSQGDRVAYVLCGDFNIEPHYPAYELLKERKLNDDEFSKLQTVDYLGFPVNVERPKQVHSKCLENFVYNNCLRTVSLNPLKTPEAKQHFLQIQAYKLNVHV